MKSTKGEREGGEIHENFHNLEKKNGWMTKNNAFISALKSGNSILKYTSVLIQAKSIKNKST